MTTKLIVNGALLCEIEAAAAKNIVKTLRDRIDRHQPGTFEVSCRYPDVMVSINSIINDSTLLDRHPISIKIRTPEYECSRWLFDLLFAIIDDR